MCEDRDFEYHRRHHYIHHHGCHPHHRGYSSIIKRTEDQVVVPEVLLDVASVDVGDYVEISIRKVHNHRKHRME